MKGARTPGGYTIIEVMIVLAVSAVMFLIAASFISGKEEATSFPQGVNQLASSIQNTVSQVSDGQYSDVDLSCNSGGSSLTISLNPQPTDTQGTQYQCIFLGKIDQFFSNTTGSLTYNTYTVAGLRLLNGVPAGPDPNRPSTPLDLDQPTVISQLNSTSEVPQNLQVTSMGLSNSSNFTAPFPVSYALGVMQSLGTYNDSAAQNGAQPVQLYYVNGISGTDPPDVSSNLGTNLTLVPQNKDIVMCVTDGTQYAYIAIGSINNQIDVRVDKLGGTSC
jgi:prepilin-type N-terminal cleavage/methylation domain-containing protein